MNDFQIFSDYLPNYLTDATRRSLQKDLKKFLSNEEISENPFINNKEQHFLQGDILQNVPFPYWSNNKFNTYNQNTLCILLTNTCDMDISNKRPYSIDCTLAPILRYSKLKKLLQKQKFSNEKINQFQENLKKYQITNFFYLPIDNDARYCPHDDGSIIALDKAFSLPRRLLKLDQRVKTLNQFFSYLLLFKMSVHFCRFHDKVDRNTI
ncbi:hypothetical protein [Commensalibacter melissae]|uniref:hypothetical protein n=1 Tax=Commensalibacter melissae TaxID=2070537 RepID=UPI001322D91D|nr:hypothetical protein [Commensalibacter melissae]MUH04040.1 hypothetical protein [Commensalibacter melissae]